LNPNQAAQQSLGLDGVGQAFGRALVSQCHPRMLFALLMPFLIVLGAVIVLLFVALGPLTSWLSQQVSDSTMLLEANDWLVSIGLFSLLTVKAWMLTFIAIMVLLPASGILGLAVAAVFVMPLVVSHLSQHRYAEVSRRGEYAFMVSFWNALWVSVVFLLGWVLTLPFWLFPPLGLLVSLLWGYTFNDDTAFLMLALVVLGIVVGITALLVRGSFGRSLMAIRDSESAAQTYGKHVNAVKTLSVAVAAGLAGVAGSLYAFYISFINVESFVLETSILLMAMVIIGGTGTLFGPIVGAALLMSLPAALTYLPFLPPTELGSIQQIIYGLAMVLLMMFRPGGLVGGRSKEKSA